MKSVSFLRNTWRRKEHKTSTDCKRETIQIRRDIEKDTELDTLPLPYLSNTISNKPSLPLPSLPPFDLTFGPEPNNAGGDDSNDTHTGRSQSAIGDEKASRSDQRLRTENFWDASERLRNYGIAINTNHGPPPNSRHGPPQNARHGPPNLSVVHPTVLSCLPPSRSLQRPHRPPRIIIHPPGHRRPMDTNAVANPRSPPRVTFVLPTESEMSHSPRSAIFLGKNRTHCDSTPDFDCSTAPLVTHNSPSHSPVNLKNCFAEEDTITPKTVHAVLDLSSPLNQRSLYRSTSSTPYLPYTEAKSLPALPPVDTGRSDTLSLFPHPPPLVVRKRIPKPLVLKATPSIAPLPPSPMINSAGFSSTDSTPVATPTTSRPSSSHSSNPLKPIISTTKYTSNRFISNIPPLFYDPPTSPLPTPPLSPSPRTQSETAGNIRPLRITKSASQLRNDVITLSATHRLTCSEPLYEARRTQSRPEVNMAHYACDPPTVSHFLFPVALTNFNEGI